MSAWGTPELRDACTIALLERDGWRGPRDYLGECCWCGMPYWRRFLDAVVPEHADYCSAACYGHKTHWFRIAAVGRAHLNRIRRESKRRAAARRAAA
jgi:hypothetical protein